MSYIDDMKARLSKAYGINSPYEDELNLNKIEYSQGFKEDPSYKLAKLKKRSNDEESDLDTRIINDKNNPLEKKIYVKPDTEIEVGDYIFYSDNYKNRKYLVLSVEDNLISPRANCQECNHLFKWIYKDIVHEAYGIGTNQTKYTLGTDVIQVGLTESDSQYAIEFSNNENCKTLKVGQRLIFNESAWKVTQIEYVSSQDKIRSVLLGQDSINSEIDDLDNEIAGGFANKHTYTYGIPTSFEVANGNEYVLNYSIKDELGKDFDYSLITVTTTTDNTLINLVNTNGVISITGLNVGVGSIKLSIPSGSTSTEFVINFEVKDAVADKVEYTNNFSQGTTLKTYVSTTVSINKLINSIVDTSAVVNYSLDAIGTTLLNSGNISIARKTNTSFQIKNVNVGVNKSFVITFTDNADGSIIATQTIQLSGM